MTHLFAALWTGVVVGLAAGLAQATPPDEHDDHPPPPQSPTGLDDAERGPVEIGQVPRHGVPVYQNLSSTGLRYTLFTTMVADDLHMTSGGGMVGFTFTYSGSGAFCGGFWSGTATARFYQNNADNTLLPSASTLITTINVPISGTGQSSYIRHVDVPTPVMLPRDVWMGLSFGGGVIGGSGLITASGTPALGSSVNAHYTGQHGYVVAPHGPVYANYLFAVYIPGPGTAGIVAGVLVLGARRRRG